MGRDCKYSHAAVHVFEGIKSGKRRTSRKNYLLTHSKVLIPGELWKSVRRQVCTNNRCWCVEVSALTRLLSHHVLVMT